MGQTYKYCLAWNQRGHQLCFQYRASEMFTVSADLCPCDFRGHFAAFLSRALKSSEPTAPPFHSISGCVKILLSFAGEGEEKPHTREAFKLFQFPCLWAATASQGKSSPQLHQTNRIHLYSATLLFYPQASPCTGIPCSSGSSASFDSQP